MKEIKLRAWNKSTKWMCCNFTDETFYFDTNLLVSKDGKDTWEIMQFTGLKDKNGKDIYGGDIVILLCDGEKRMCEVKQNKTYCTLDGGILGAGELQTENIEVIGNIYENPELLDDKEFETEEDYIKLHKRQAFIQKCSNKKCKKEIEDWAFDNKDADGNLYCMDCQSKLTTIMEMEDYENANN